MLIQSNAFKIPLDDKSVHCAVTSPPYYSLRKYSGEQEFVFGGDKDCAHEWGEYERKRTTGGDSTKSAKQVSNTGSQLKKEMGTQAFCHKCNAWRGAYGLEPTLEMYIDHTVEWCREVHRVLRDDGTFWLNLGDSYAASQTGSQGDNKSTLGGGKATQIEAGKRPSKIGNNLKPKDLMGVPWRVALALQADGWYLRSDIIWAKPNPMPESVTDRPTKSHEYLFLLTKNKTYYYDADAIREPQQMESKLRSMRGWGGDTKRDYVNGPKSHIDKYFNKTEEEAMALPGRNKRTVWTIATAPYSGAHFATYPPALVEPCIKAGTSEKGVCPECGNPWERVVEKSDLQGPGHENYKLAKAQLSKDDTQIKGRSDGWWPNHYKATETLGWQRTCEHDLEPIPATVFDPFSGSATTLLVARKLGRNGIGLDISADYLDLARERLSLKALDEWEQGIQVGETDYEGLPMFEV